MARKRIRIDIMDDDGSKVNLSMEGNLNKEKLLKFFEMMNLVNIEESEQRPDLNSVGGRILNVIEKHFPLGRFTSSDVREKYEDEYNQPVKLSVISTYLARFTTKGTINRSKAGREWAYQVPKLTQLTR